MKAAVLPASIHRVGRLPDPFAWPDWAFAEPNGTFGNRFDDPLATYRVLYAATEREGAYVETLARFRPDPAVLAALDAIEAHDDEPDPPRGVVPAKWFAPRAMGLLSSPGRSSSLVRPRRLPSCGFASPPDCSITVSPTWMPRPSG